MILFAELEWLAIVIGDELARGETLAVGERGQFCILLAAGTREVGQEFLIERFATFLQQVIIARGGLKQIGGLPTVTAPVWPQVFAHVLDRVKIVVGEHEPPHIVPVRGYLEDKRGNRHIAAVRAGLSRVAGRQLARCHETGAGRGA